MASDGKVSGTFGRIPSRWELKLQNVVLVAAMESRIPSRWELKRDFLDVAYEIAKCRIPSRWELKPPFV